MWYVVQTESGREQSAIEKCRNALDRMTAVRIFSPVCQLEKKYQGEWKSADRTAFPGYVFIESDSPNELEDKLKRIPGVVTPVRIGGGFYPIRADEEAVLRQLMDGNDCIRVSVGYLVDQKLVIVKGPLEGFSEAVKWIDRHKRVADIEMLLFNERRKMRVGLEVKAKMTAAEYREMVKSG